MARTDPIKDRVVSLFTHIPVPDHDGFKQGASGMPEENGGTVFIDSELIATEQVLALAEGNNVALLPHSLPKFLRNLEVSDKTPVGSLHLQNFRVASNVPSREVDLAFRADSELVGVIVQSDTEKPRVVSRGKFYELLGKTFGVSIFINRPIGSMLSALNLSTFEVAAEMGIAEAVQLALERNANETFEPLLIAFQNGEYYLLDISILFQAEMKLLVWLQQQVQQDNFKLEKQVNQRTVQLSRANSSLQQEVLERRRAQEKLDVLLLYERTLTLCAQSLLLQGDRHEVIKETLEHLLRAVGSSRVFILEVVENGKPGVELALTNQMELPGTSPLPLEPWKIPGRKFDGWLDTLQSGNYVIGQFDELPADETQLMRDLGLISVLLIPIGEEGLPGRVIGLGEIFKRRDWDENEIQLLYTVARMLHSYYTRERTTLELAAAHDEALEASRFKSELLAKVSHELRTPLGAIMGYTQLLKSGSYGSINDEQKEAAEIVVSSSKFLTTLVNGLLDQAQLDNGQLSLLKVPYKLQKVAAEVESRIRVLAESKGLGFEISIAPQVPDELLGDRIRLEQILTNLLGNAVKFTEAGRVGMDISVSETNQLVIQVSDTGTGIPENARARIFDEFVQVDGSPTRRQGGTGLGLSIARQLITLMQGKISLVSEVGKGSVFTVQIPITLPSKGSD